LLPGRKPFLTTRTSKKNENHRGWNKLKSYGGKQIGEAAKSGYTFKAPGKKDKQPVPAAEVAAVAEKKRSSLREKVASGAIEARVTAAGDANKKAMDAEMARKLAGLQKGGAAVGTASDLHDLAYKPPAGGGLADSAQGMHDRMQGADKLSPAKKLELENTRALLSKMATKLAKFKEAEAKILKGEDVNVMELMMM